MSSALTLIDNIITQVEEETEQKEDRFTLGYWNIGGYAAPARMMLYYAGVQYKEVMYNARNEWYDIKFKMDLDFPNIPYLIDHRSNIRCTESLAIYAYLARTLGIGSQSDPDLLYNDMVIGFLKDMWKAWGDLCYRNWPQGKDQYLKETMPAKLKLLEKWLKNEKGSKRTYFTGDSIAVCDFIAYYLLFSNLKLEPKILDKETYPELNRFYDSFAKLPFMEKYRSNGLEDLPLNGSIAGFR